MGLETFDEKGAKWLETLYAAPDMVAQRSRVLEALALRPGEQALDIGTGPGFLAQAMAEAVGPKGRIEGVDLSAPMVAAASARGARLPWLRFREGDAASLPFADASFDAATAVQVYLYVPELAGAFAELKRVLKPGGRAVVVDTDWDSVVWYTTDRPRMARIMAAWERHFHDGHVASRLAAALRAAGFRLERQSVLPILNPAYEQASFSVGMIPTIRDFVARKGGIAPDEAAAWAEELQARGRDGSYFFSLNRYLFSVRKDG